MVYSTNPDFRFDEGTEEEAETLLPSEQDLRVRPEKKGRKGKTVTIITGFKGKQEDLEELARVLKTGCGTGGSVKDGEIIIQGNFVEKILAIFERQNYRAKRSGG
jgi:translation initiation factor 1